MSLILINLRLIDYFDSVINDVDIEAEMQLVQYQNDSKKSEYINDVRDRLIEEINLIKDLCDLRKRNESIDFSNAKDDDIFKEFCFFIGSKYLHQYQDYDFGLLVKTDFCLSSSQIKDLK
jgi:hypothetical protein